MNTFIPHSSEKNEINKMNERKLAKKARSLPGGEAKSMLYSVSATTIARLGKGLRSGYTPL